MAKTKPNINTRRKMWLVFVIVLIGMVTALFSLQSFALWLPFRSTLQFAANATVWPQVQLTLILATGLVSISLWRLMHRRLSVLFFSIFILCLLPTSQMIVALHSAAAQHSVASPVASIFKIHREQSPADEVNVIYGKVGDSKLYLSVYKATGSGSKPVIIYVHGGGWSGGNRDENSGFFRRLNNAGYEVLSIDYRFASAKYASWQDAPRDVVCALAWVTSNAETHKYDLSNITLMGDSAGAQLALRAGYGLTNSDIDSSCGGTPAPVKKVIGIVPAIDFRELYDDPQLGATSRSNVVRYLGGTPHNAPRAYEESTIVNHVVAGLPSTLLINAANDTLVSPASGERLARALRSAGNTVNQYTIPYAVHSYWINPGGYQNLIANELILQFLKQ